MSMEEGGEGGKRGRVRTRWVDSLPPGGVSGGGSRLELGRPQVGPRMQL